MNSIDTDPFDLVDLHCHLLPGIDDGPKTLADALAMCRIAVNNGISKAVVTPHIIPGRYDNTLASITGCFRKFVRELEREHIDLALGMAAEVRLDPVIMDMAQSNTLPLLGELHDEPLLLLEFPHDQIPPGSDELVNWLLREGIRPVIAHPERNGDVMRRLSKIKPFVTGGCYLQLTGGSLTGVFGDIPKKRAIEMLKQGWVTVIASDAHNLHKRIPELEPARLIAAKYVGAKEAWNLVKYRPTEIAAKNSYK